ncbi:myosin heavy chain, clone 203-like [Bolinopsis microptera]|uniref:myosin heavy chain, clone 203-like n=1 Tax=Bolinopsis microptera TaxID=2820187 RepID=UPI00307A5305
MSNPVTQESNESVRPPQEAISPRPRSTATQPPKKEFSIWKDFLSPIFCCRPPCSACCSKEGYQEIGPETAEEMTQRIQDLHSMYDRLNEQLQTVQSSSEMQRILQERLVEQVHELDDLISNNKSQLYTELQELADREEYNRGELRDALLGYLEEDRLKEIEDVLTGHSNNSAQMVEQILSVKSRVICFEEDVVELTRAISSQAESVEKLDARILTCENRAGIGEEEKALLLEEVKQNSVLLKEQEDATLNRISHLESTNELLLAKFENGEDGQKQVDSAFITRLAENDREQSLIKTKLGSVERKVDTLATRGYVDNLVKSLEDDRNQFITKSVERTTLFHIEQSKKELAQKQALRIGEIEGKLEGLRVLVTGLVKSVETRDSELTHMNKSYFDELQRHVDDTSEELRRTFAEFKVVKRNFEEQHRRMSSLERTLDKTGDMTAMEDDIHVLAKKLDRLENRVEHVVDKVVELGDRSPSPELDDLARLKRDLRKGTKPLNPSSARRRNDSSLSEDTSLSSLAADQNVTPVDPGAGRRKRQLSGLGDKSALAQ